MIIDEDKFKVIINDVDYSKKTQIGMVLNETLTEELDSMTIVISDIPRTLFEPFQDAKITLPDDGTITRCFYINTAMEEIFDISEKTYQYTISLISQTKLLERVQLPNLKVRKPISKRYQTTIYEMFQKVLRYINKQFPTITINSKLKELTENLECPEIEWSVPNAKQVFNDLLQTIPNNPCLVKMVNNSITYVSLTKKGVNIDEDYNEIKIMPYEVSEQMSNYANSVIMDSQNVIPSSNEIQIAIVSSRSEDVDLTTDNVELIIPNAKIEKIEKMYVLFCFGRVTIKTTTYENVLTKIDITDNVVEQTIYNSKEILKGVNVDNLNVKNNLLYFEHGKNKIQGLSTKYGFFNDNLPLANAITRAFNKKNFELVKILNNVEELPTINYDIDNISFSSNAQNIANNVRAVSFEIHYQSITDQRVKVFKDEKENKDVSIYLNQNQAYINGNALMKTLKDSVNRLGNEEIKVTMICDYDSIPQLADWFIDENYILSSKEVSYQPEFAIVNATFNKYYVQKNLYYGVTERKKFTQIAQANESVIREEYLFYRINLSTESTCGSVGQKEELMVNHLMSFFDKNKTTLNGIKITECAFQDKYKVERYASFYPNVKIMGKSIFYSIQCEDNYNVGNKIVKDESKKRYVNTYVPYVDKDGEFVRVYINFFSDFTNNMEYVANYDGPIVNFPGSMIGSNLFYSDFILVYKDNGETFKATWQFDFVSEDNSVILGDAIAFNNALVNNANIKKCALVSMTKRLDEKYPIISNISFWRYGNNQDGTLFNIYIDDNDNFFIEFIDSIITTISSTMSYALLDENDNLIFAVNRKQDGTLPNKIYFNVKGEER